MSGNTSEQNLKVPCSRPKKVGDLKWTTLEEYANLRSRGLKLRVTVNNKEFETFEMGSFAMKTFLEIVKEDTLKKCSEPTYDQYDFPPLPKVSSNFVGAQGGKTSASVNCNKANGLKRGTSKVKTTKHASCLKGRPMTCFVRFFTENVESIRQSAYKTNTNISREGARMWKALPEEERQRYVKIAAEELQAWKQKQRK